MAVSEHHGIRQLTRWLGLLSGILTIVIGLTHICTWGAKVRWPEDHFTDDVNGGQWRGLFTFRPSVLASEWLPLVVGVIAVLLHMRFMRFSWFTKTFMHYFVSRCSLPSKAQVWNKRISRAFLISRSLQLFNMFKGLFCDIAYSGGMGIVFSVVTWIVCALSLYCWWSDERLHDVSLRLDPKHPTGAHNLDGTTASPGP